MEHWNCPHCGAKNDNWACRCWLCGLVNPQLVEAELEDEVCTNHEEEEEDSGS